MLKVCGHLYSDNNKEFFEQMASALEDAGFQLAYEYPTNAMIIREVEDIEDGQGN